MNIAGIKRVNEGVIAWLYRDINGVVEKGVTYRGMRELLLELDGVDGLGFVTKLYDRALVELLVRQIMNNNRERSLEEIVALMPESFCVLPDRDARIVDVLEAGGYEKTVGGWRKDRENLCEYVAGIRDERRRKAVLTRLEGKTLCEIGEEMKVTRERVRQMIKAVMKKGIGRLREDDYWDYYEKYDLGLEDFCHIFAVKPSVYHYLDLIVCLKHGTRKLEQLVNDRSLTVEMRERVRERMHCDCVKLGNEYVEKTFRGIATELLRVHHSEKPVKVTEFCDECEKEFESLGCRELLGDTSTRRGRRALELRVGNLPRALLTGEGSMRYTECTAEDAIDLLKKLDFADYKDMNVSVKLLYDRHRAAFESRDIWTELELHNLMRRYQNVLPKDVTLERMPMITVGKADRDEQTLRWLREMMPVSLNDFVMYMVEHTGALEQTVRANWLECTKEYLKNGVYTDGTEDTAELSKTGERLRELLTADFYFISDVKAAYKAKYGCEPELAWRDLYKLGYHCNRECLLRNEYKDVSDYVRRGVVGDKTVIDMRDFEVKFRNYPPVYRIFDAWTRNGEWYEISLQKYQRADSFGLKDIAELVTDYVETVNDLGLSYWDNYGLRKSGFRHAIYDLGCDDWFYDSLFDHRIDGVGVTKYGGNRLAGRGKVTVENFLVDVLKGRGKMSCTELEKYLHDEYGMQFKGMYFRNSLYDIGSRIKFDSVNDKVWSV